MTPSAPTPSIRSTGAIGEARILFTDTEDVKAGARATMAVAAGQSLGLFLIPDTEEIGIELEDFEEGGLFFRNYATGDVADLHDGDDATTYTPGPATIFDGIAPVVTDDEGNLLPIRAFHSVGDRDGFNFLNPVAGQNARAFADGMKGVDVVAFEDGLASLPGADDDEGGYDRDFNDAFVAVSDGSVEPAGGGRAGRQDRHQPAGRHRRDGQQTGTGKDDQLVALDGNDVIRARGGDDIDRGRRRQRPRLRRRPATTASSAKREAITCLGGRGRDEIEGGEGRDRICGGGGRDDIEGDEGADRLLRRARFRRDRGRRRPRPALRGQGRREALGRRGRRHPLRLHRRRRRFQSST